MSPLVPLVFALAPLASPSSLLALDPIVVDGDPALARKAAELLRQRMESRKTTTVTEDEALARASGDGESRSFVQAKAALNRGKDLYLQLQLDEALEALSQARRGFQRVLLESNVFEPFAETLSYQGATYIALGDEERAREAFLELLRVRPGFVLDEKVYPPDVLRSFGRAQQAAARAPQGRLTVVSSPPLARVIIDGEQRGQTPLTVEGLRVGAHAVRVEVDGRTPWWGMVAVPESDARVEVHLEQDVLSSRLSALKRDLSAPGVPLEGGRELARAARTDGVLATGFSAFAGGYVVSVALLSEGAARVVWTAVDADFFFAEQATSALADALFSAGNDAPVFVPSGVPPPSRAPDFEASLLGVASTASAAAGPAAVSSHSPPGAAATHAAGDGSGEEAQGGGALWLWAGAGAGAALLLAGGAVAGVVWALAPAPEERQPDTVGFRVMVTP